MNKIFNSVFEIVGVISFFLLFIFGISLTFSGVTSDDKRFGILFTIILLGVPAMVTLFIFFKERGSRKSKDDLSWYGGQFDDFFGDDLLKLKQDTTKLFEEINFQELSLSDYSFIVFPLAKSYEGFLKKLLIRLKLVKESDLKLDPYIAINHYFNPHDGIADKFLIDKKRDKTVPALIYSVYQDCRNSVLHYDLHRNTAVKDIEDAQFLCQRIEDAIVKAYTAFIRTKK